MFLSLIRVLKFALQDIFRNLSLSIMTVLMLVLMLLSINTLVIINVLTGEATQAVKSQLDVSIYFNPEATNQQIQEIRSYIGSFPEVVEMTYWTKEQGLEQFRNQHKNNPEVIAALDELGGNPLGSTLIVKTREPADYQKIISALNVPEYQNTISAKTFGDTEKAIQRIQTITTQVERFTAGLSSLFALIAFLIIFNTIRVAIYTQRIEISIKKLVGATDWFIRGPYLAESLIFSFVSIFITYGLIRLSIYVLDPYVAVVFSQHSLLTNYFNSHTMSLLGIQFLAVLLLTIFSSLLAMRRYLRV